MPDNDIVDVSQSSSNRMGIVTRRFHILQRNAWRNSGRARIAGDVLMGASGVASGNPMLAIAGFSGLFANGMLAKYGGFEGLADPDVPFLRRVVTPSRYPVDTNAFWNMNRSLMMTGSGCYAALVKGDIGEGIGVASAGMIGVSFNTILLSRRALSRLGDRIPVRTRVPLPSDMKSDLPGADQEIEVGQSRHRVRALAGDGWNAVKGVARSILKRAPFIASVLAYPGIAAWAIAGTSAIASGTPVVGGMMLGSAAMQGLGIGFKMIVPAIKVEFKKQQDNAIVSDDGTALGSKDDLGPLMYRNGSKVTPKTADGPALVTPKKSGSEVHSPPEP